MLDETTTKILLWTAAIPLGAGITGGVLARLTGRGALGGLGVAAGFALAYAGTNGWPTIPPGEALAWIPFVGIAAVILAAITDLESGRPVGAASTADADADDAEDEPDVVSVEGGDPTRAASLGKTLVRALGVGGGAALGAGLVLRPLLAEWSHAEAAAWIGGTAALAVFLAEALLARSAIRRAYEAPLLLKATAGTFAALAALGGSALLGQLGGGLGAAIAGLALVGLISPAMPVTSSAIAAGLAPLLALVVYAHHLGGLELLPLLVGLVPLLAARATLEPGGFGARLRNAIALALIAALPAALALGLGYRDALAKGGVASPAGLGQGADNYSPYDDEAEGWGAPDAAGAPSGEGWGGTTASDEGGWGELPSGDKPLTAAPAAGVRGAPTSTPAAVPPPAATASSTAAGE